MSPHPLLRLAAASATALSLFAVGACTSPIANYCSEKASCEDLVPQQEELCELDINEDRDSADVWGCVSEWDKLMDCVLDNMRCENRGTPQADFKVDENACDGLAEALDDCIDSAINDVVECAPGCTLGMLDNDRCDSACDVEQCAFDSNDCATSQCSSGCSDSMRGNGFCDSACDNVSCGYDLGDCNGSGECAQGCPNSYRGDGSCDSACNNSLCNYDDGDCN